MANLIDSIIYAGAAVGKSALRAYLGAREQITPDDYGTVDRTGVVASTSALQAALNVGGDIYLKAGTYKLAAGLSVAVAKTRLICAAGVILSFASVGASTAAIVQAANDFKILGYPKIVGPAAAAYVGDEAAIKAVGTSSASRKSGLVVEAEIYNFGAYGIYAKWCDDISIGGKTYIHDVGYAGIAALSCNHGSVAPGARIKDVTPGTGSNMYGLTLTHDSTGYSSDGNASSAPKSTLNPFCQDWTILDLQVENVAWEGIDAHGCYGLTVSFCRTYNCRIGIAVASSSGDAGNYAGWDNKVLFCLVDARKADGTAGSYANLDSGIIVNGPSTPGVAHQRVLVQGNFVYGYGVVSNSSTGAIQAKYVNGVQLIDNIVESWGGVGINITGAADALARGNKGRQLASGADSVAVFILNSSATDIEQHLAGNSIRANGGTAAKTGFQTAALRRPVISGGNDFRAATLAPVVTDYASGFFAGTDMTAYKQLDLGSGGGSVTVDLSEFNGTTPKIFLAVTANTTTIIANLTGVPVFTEVEIMVLNGSASITIDRSNMTLGGSANFVMTSYDIWKGRKIGTSGIVWTEISRSANG